MAMYMFNPCKYIALSPELGYVPIVQLFCFKVWPVFEKILLPFRYPRVKLAASY